MFKKFWQMAFRGEWETLHWFLLMCVPFAFLSFISFAQINSYWADKHHFNGVFGWLGLGILFALVACYGLYKTASGGYGGKQP